MFELFDAAGNRFVLHDARATHSELDVPALARELCAQDAVREGWQADGLLMLSADKGADAAMQIYNADGSRAEACGNGLRCVAWHLLRDAERSTCSIETDCGVRRARIVEREEQGALLSTELGVARSMDLSRALAGSCGALPATVVDVGNPHCVLEVADERAVDLAQIARTVQAHPDFPQGVNVGAVALRDGRWYLRVHERGVGETEACGTGACAAASALERHARVAFPITLHLPGGPLVVERATDGVLALTGPVRSLGSAAVAREA